MPPRKRKLNNSGILSNSYIPPFTATQIERELQKLPPDSLYSLTHLWLSITATQPTPDASQIEQGFTKESLSKIYIKKLEKLNTIKAKVNLKKKLINTILVELYPRGLNTLQLAQIDVQLLVDKPNSNLWVASTAKIVNKTTDIPNDEQISLEKLNELTNYTFSLDSQLFLDNFVSNLSNLFLTHVYISRHPYYPLILIRVQMYNYSHRRPKDTTSSSILSDLTNDSLDRTAKLKFEQDFQRIINNKIDKKSLTDKIVKNGFERQIQIQNKPQIIPHKPFYILLPVSSPHVIHTPTLSEDISTKLILQTLETTLSHSKIAKNKLNGSGSKKLSTNSSILTDTKIKIFLDSDVSTPIRNLNTIFTLKGISRFGSSIGAWAPYADNIVDIGIFGDENKHQTIQPEVYVDLTEDDEDVQSDRKRVAALKFKGCISKLKSKDLFEVGVGDQRRDIRNDGDKSNVSIEEIEDFNTSNSFVDSKHEILKDAYASTVPIHECKFQIEDDLVEFFKQQKSKGSKKINKSSKDSTFHFKMDLYGTDVFGGLHELAVNGVVDPYTIPDWLTGESGSVGGVIKKGKITRKR